MKCFQSKIRTNTITLCFIILSTIILGGCQATKVAPYNDALYIETINTGNEIDRFYVNMLEIAQQDRLFQTYAEKYLVIETKLQSLYSRNMARKYNHESTKISKLTLNLWRKYKTVHKSKNKYSNSKITFDKDRFNRLFASAASAENSKIAGE